MLDSLPLHDAILREVCFAWEAGCCTLNVVTVDSEQQLVFTGVTELNVPKEQPWGPSVSINSARESGPNKFEVELQSGDVLRLQASGWTFAAKGRS
jgi:hypothetical protein